MKRTGKQKRIANGLSSAVLLSIFIHGGLFLLAGMLIVFTVVKKEEKKFEPPQAVERPKMKLKKPKVKVRKSAKPKSTARIVTKAKSSMVDIALPEITGMGEGWAGGIGDGFDLMPNLAELTVLGSVNSIGNDLEGTLYDLKFTRAGDYNPLPQTEWRYLFNKFFQEWDPRVLSKFYRSPKKLYTTCPVLPPFISAMAPVAFGVDDSMASGGEWIVHYKGKLVYKEDITFRFWVFVDDSLAIRVDNKVVIAASLIERSGDQIRAPLMFGGAWHSTSPHTGKYRMPGLATVGDWITLEAGEAKDIEIMATDNPSLGAYFLILVEEQGRQYPKGVHGGPLLPVFRTAELSHDHLDIIYRNLPDGIADFVNGPIFRDY